MDLQALAEVLSRSNLKKVVFLSQQQWYEIPQKDPDVLYITPTDNYGGVIGERGPKGDKGDRGEQGLPGAKGERGEAAFEMEIDSVVTLPPGQAAFLQNVGTKELQRYVVGVPSGQRGVQGERGEKGEKGDDGSGMVMWDRLVLRSDGFSVSVGGERYDFVTEHDQNGKITAITDGIKRRTIAYE